jgi:hypothetical protein
MEAGGFSRTLWHTLKVAKGGRFEPATLGACASCNGFRLEVTVWDG